MFPVLSASTGKQDNASNAVRTCRTKRCVLAVTLTLTAALTNVLLLSGMCPVEVKRLHILSFCFALNEETNVGNQHREGATF